MNRNQPNHDTIIHRIVFLAELISSKTRKYAHKGTKAQTNDRTRPKTAGTTLPAVFLMKSQIRHFLMEKSDLLYYNVCKNTRLAFGDF